jgi:hypothetical protein
MSLLIHWKWRETVSQKRRCLSTVTQDIQPISSSTKSRRTWFRDRRLRGRRRKSKQICHTRNCKMGKVFPENLFWPRRKYSYLRKKLITKWRRQYSNNIRRHFFLNCRQVICIITSSVQQYRGRCTSPWGWLEKSSTQVWRDKELFFPFRICSKIPCLVAATRWSHQSVSSSALMPAWICPSLSVNFETVTVLSLRLGSGSSASSMELCFRISKNFSNVNSWPR